MLPFVHLITKTEVEAQVWLFGQKGFLSIVQHKDDHDLLLVRARAKGDIERYFPAAIVRENEGSDYRFRASIPRFEVVNRIAKTIHDINYPDFKESIQESDRIPWYLEVWATMATMQGHFELMEKRNDPSNQAYSEGVSGRSRD